MTRDVTPKVPELESLPGDVLPDLPDDAYGPDAQPLADPEFLVKISLIGNSRGHKHGDEIDVSAATADKLVRAHKAELVPGPAAEAD